MVCQVAELLVPLHQCKVGLFLRIAKLGVLAGGALGADGLEIDGGKDGVTGFDAARRPFLQQRIGGLAASRTVEDVNVQTRHGDPPVMAGLYASAAKAAVTAVHFRVLQPYSSAWWNTLPRSVVS